MKKEININIKRYFKLHLTKNLVNYTKDSTVEKILLYKKRTKILFNKNIVSQYKLLPKWSSMQK